MRSIVLLTIITFSIGAETNLTFSATIIADIPISSVWRVTSTAITDEDIYALCSSKLVWGHQMTLAAAKTATFISDYTGFDAEDTIGSECSNSHLYSFIITVNTADIAKDRPVSVTIYGFCDDFSPLGTYTSMITTANGDVLIDYQPVEISNPDAIEGQASEITAFVVVILIIIMI